MRQLLWFVAVIVLFCSPDISHGGSVAANIDEALDYLKKLPRQPAGTSKYDCRTYEDKNVDGLHPEFALNAAHFLYAYTSSIGYVEITSAHRSKAEQKCVCVGERGPCAGRTRFVKKKNGKRRKMHGGLSQHQAGKALDVRAGTGSDAEYACMQRFAHENPQFEVRFPHGMRDRPHMEPSVPKRVRMASSGGGLATTIPAICDNVRSLLHDPNDELP